MIIRMNQPNVIKRRGMLGVSHKNDIILIILFKYHSSNYQLTGVSNEDIKHAFHI